MADLLVLVCIIYSGTSVIQILVLVHVYKIQWNLSIDSMGLALVCIIIIHSGTSFIIIL